VKYTFPLQLTVELPLRDEGWFRDWLRDNLTYRQRELLAYEGDSAMSQIDWLDLIKEQGYVIGLCDGEEVIRLAQSDREVYDHIHVCGYESLSFYLPEEIANEVL